MATIDWPSTLPDNLLRQGYEEQPPDLTVRTEMEEGPDKVRRWGTGNVRPIAGQLLLDSTQAETLDDFYLNTTKSGALRWNWTHPRTGASAEFRFRERPSYTPVGVYWRVQLQLEIMP